MSDDIYEFVCAHCRVPIRLRRSVLSDGEPLPELCPPCEVRPLTDAEIERYPGEPEGKL